MVCVSCVVRVRWYLLLIRGGLLQWLVGLAGIGRIGPMGLIGRIGRMGNGGPGPLGELGDEGLIVDNYGWVGRCKIRRNNWLGRLWGIEN